VGTLWVVATPIGNLEDMTYRAVRVLASVGRILCEDTRRTRTLLDHFKIAVEAPLVRFDAHVERDRLDEVLGWLGHGEVLALVSDAGTPGINDPGERLVRAAALAGHRVIPVPGASSVTAAVSVSGLGGGGFAFGGFMPKGADALRTKLVGLAKGTWVFFVPARDIEDALLTMATLPTIGEVVVAREMTKLHESFYRGTAHELIELLSGNDEARLGEAVVVFSVGEAPLGDDVVEALLREQMAQGKTPKAAVEAVAGALGLPRRRVYQLALKIDAKR